MEVLTRLEKLTLSEEALVLHAEVLHLNSPGSRALEVFKDWFNRKKPFAGRGNKLMENDDIAAI